MRIPVATYRLQFNAGFRFDDAARIIPYLRSLGITDIYASPLLQAHRGSTHGYDVTDPTRLNPALGTEAEFKALIGELHRNGMGLLLDVVPNHMAANTENPWWRSVLEYGPASPHAAKFDIDWGPEGKDKLLVPTLGAPYGDVLRNGALALALDDEGYFIRYYEHRFPVCPWTYRSILARAAHRSPNGGAADELALPLVTRLLQQADLYAMHLSTPAEAHRYGEELKQHLLRSRRESPALDRLLRESLADWQVSGGGDARLDRLDALLSQQTYRLAHWHLAAEAVNYRRFFDINDLAGLRVEDEAVFDATHEKILALVHDGSVTGLRIDHIDGLVDPSGYLHRLRQRLGDFYVVVEKILGPDETIPRSWPVAGTTGYDFNAVANGLFVNPRGLHYLDQEYGRFTGNPKPFSEIVQDAKQYVIRRLFSGELEKLGAWLARLAANDRDARDIPKHELREALLQVTAALPVYRTYTTGLDVAAIDKERLTQALATAIQRTPEEDAGASAFGFLERTLLLEAQPEEALRWVRRWQQFSGSVMAKGLEDTAFFRHTRLISLNAVGGLAEEVETPADVQAFHRHNLAERETWSNSLNTISTHDTKRTADVSARINAVSEIPFAWARAFRRWRRLTKPFRRQVASKTVPSPEEEMMLYQTLAGSWPWSPVERSNYGERMQVFARKAAREAKINTDWIRPNEAYENALTAFVHDLLDGEPGAAFREDFAAIDARIAFLGALNGLSQSLLLATAPGVPDIYQGTELWDFSLTDPDNRRPVDFDLRRRLLAALPTDSNVPPDEAVLEELLENWRDGRIKLYVLSRALRLRAKHTALFQEGEYTPLFAAGIRQRNVCAFARQHGDDWALTVVPRQIDDITKKGRFPRARKSWGGTFLKLPLEAPDEWVNVFTGEKWNLRPPGVGDRQFPLHDIFQRFPVALLRGHREGR